MAFETKFYLLFYINKVKDSNTGSHRGWATVIVGGKSVKKCRLKIFRKIT